MIVFVGQYNAAPISRLIRRDGLTIWTKVEDIPKMEGAQFGFSALERVHAMILDISQPDENVQYLLAQAIVQHKPTLCLYNRTSVPRDLLNYLSQKNIPPSITTKVYTDSSLEHCLEQFLISVDDSLSNNEHPSIKFTLRLTPTLDRYLQWLVQHRGINKAEYLRSMLQKTMQQDNEYRDWS